MSLAAAFFKAFTAQTIYGSISILQVYALFSRLISYLLMHNRSSMRASNPSSIHVLFVAEVDPVVGHRLPEAAVDCSMVDLEVHHKLAALDIVVGCKTLL